MITEHIVGNVRDGVTETVVNIPFSGSRPKRSASPRLPRTARNSVCASVSRCTMAIFLHGRTARCMRCGLHRHG